MVTAANRGVGYLITPPPPGGQLIDLPDLPHAWSTPYLWLFDTLRVIAIVVSLYLVYLLAFSAARSRSAPQRVLTIALNIAVLLSIWTQVERIGRPVSWRLPFVLFMAVAGVWAALQYMTAGRPWRDFTLRSFLTPPTPRRPTMDPAELARRLRQPAAPRGDPPRADPARDDGEDPP